MLSVFGAYEPRVGSFERERERPMPDTPVMVIAHGKCNRICEVNWDEYSCAEDPLTDRMRLLLCLIDGAERRQILLRRWLGQAPAVCREAPLTGNV
jgi:hypothetical protein